MSRLQISVVLIFTWALPGLALATPQDFESAPIADVPLSGPSSSEVVPITGQPSDFGSLPSPTELPLTKETLDAAAKGVVPTQSYSEAVKSGVPAPPTGYDSPNAFALPSADAATSVGVSPVFESPISPNEGDSAPTEYSLPNTTGPGIVESPFSTPRDTAKDSSADNSVDESLVQDGLYEAYPDNVIYPDGEVLCDDGTCFPGMPLPGGFGPCGGGWDFGGWVSVGATINDNGNNSANGNAPLGFNNFADGIVLNQAWLYLAKETQTNGYGFDWGFRTDFLFGADAPDTQAFGDGTWDASWDTGGQYGFAMPQMYGEVAINRTKTKFGRFFTNIGYEQVAAPYNFFYSHSLSRYYNQPFTHTGFLTQYDVKPDLILFGGWTAGWDSGFRNRNDGSTFLGGAIWNVSDCFDLMYATTAGDPGDLAAASSDVYMHSLIGDLKFGYGWNYVLQWDHQRRRSGGGPASESNALNQYLFKQLSPSLTAGIRVEYFRDDDGVRVGNGPGDYVGATLGVNWRPFSQMVVRPELRWDSFDGAGLPFDNNSSRDQFTLGMDAVYVF